MERVAFLLEATGDRLDCLLNPETVVCRRDAGLRRRTLFGRAVAGRPWSDDVLIAGGGAVTEMQLDLLFDTSLLASTVVVDDVQTLTRPFRALAEPWIAANGRIGPPLARFVWGKAWNVLGVVSAIAERFEHFLPNGAPQRSWLRMTFMQVAERDGGRRPAVGVASPDVFNAMRGRTDGLAPSAAETSDELRPSPWPYGPLADGLEALPGAAVAAIDARER